MRLAILPKDVSVPAGHYDARINLFGTDPPGVGNVGAQVTKQFRRALNRSAPGRAWDLAALAMAIVAADRHVSRAAVSSDGWTRQIDITLAVGEPALWSRLRPQVERLARFLTGDLWTISFVEGGLHPSPPCRAEPRPETCVSLLSGGLDSLIGALDLHADGKRPLFVSNRVQGDCAKQEEFAAAVGAKTVLSLNHNVKTMVARPEISQRPRSISFIAFGVLAATSVDLYADGGTVDLFIPENGFISLNVPLTRLRSGSLSTRTTHPIFLSGLQALIDELGLRVRLKNPYALKTKGEMMIACKDPDRLAALAPRSMSCGRSGRIHRHCGKCLPCLVRRSAFLKAYEDVAADVTVPGYKTPAAPATFLSPEFSRYDDVMQCREAIDVVRRFGGRRWIGSALTSGRIGDPAPLRDVALRGLREIETFLETVGLA